MFDVLLIFELSMYLIVTIFFALSLSIIKLLLFWSITQKTILLNSCLFSFSLYSNKAKEVGISEYELRLVHVWKEDENKVITIIINQLDWSYNTIADLYKKRWDIELFFKALKQNLQVKTFWGTSENAVKSQLCSFDYVSAVRIDKTNKSEI